MNHSKIQADAHTFAALLTGNNSNSLTEYSVDAEGLGSIVFSVISTTDVIHNVNAKMKELNWPNHSASYFNVVDVHQWSLKTGTRQIVTMLVKFDRDIELILTNN